MTNIIIDNRGVLLCRKGHILLVKKEGQPVQEIKPEIIERITINNGCSITSDAIILLLQNQIPVNFIGSKRFAGYLTPTGQKNTPLRYLQYKVFEIEQKRIELFREILDSKIGNQIRYLKKYFFSHDIENFKTKLLQLDTMRKGISKHNTVDSLMGYEGSIAKVYFEIYGQLFEDEYKFYKRSRRPPKDPVNSLLSYGYTILLSEINQAVQCLGLDPQVGFIHTIDYSRPSLSLDLEEEFRFLVDAVVLGLFNRGMLKAEHFEQDGEAIYITKEGRSQFFRGFEERLKTKQTYFGVEKDYRELFRHQALHIKKYIEHGVPYIGYRYNRS